MEKEPIRFLYGTTSVGYRGGSRYVQECWGFPYLRMKKFLVCSFLDVLVSRFLVPSVWIFWFLVLLAVGFLVVWFLGFWVSRILGFSVSLFLSCLVSWLLGFKNLS